MDEQRLAIRLRDQGATQAQIDTYIQLQQAIDAATQADARRADQAADEAARTSALEGQLDALREMIDPASQLTGQMETLKDIFSAGLIDDKEFDKIADGLKKINEEANKSGSSVGGIGNALAEMGQESRKAFRIMQRTQEEGTKGYQQMEVAIQAMNVVAAVGAVIKQASEGDPYTAFGRMVAMAGAMAALGVSVGNVGGGGADVSADRQDAQGTGSVLGMMDEKSESIVNATEITANATRSLVGINRGMLTALQAMQRGITGASGQIARDFSGANFNGPAQNLALDQYVSSTLGGVAGDISDFFRDPGQGLFGIEIDFVGDWMDDLLGGSSDVINQGVVMMGGTISQLINDTMIKAFQDVESKKHIFDDYDTSRQIVNLSSAASNQFRLIFASMADAVQAGGEALGMNAAQLDRAISSYRIRAQEISLKDLDAKAQQAELEAVFSSVFDGLVGSVLPFIDDFQRVGEGLGETLARVATNVQVAKEAMDRLGFFTSTGGVQGFAQLSTDLIAAAGGLEQFINGMGSFIDKFATEQHKFDVIQSDMARAFERVNLEIPETRDGMWELMQTLNAGTESGRAQIAALLELSATADEYYQQLDKAQKDALRAEEEAFRSARAAGISAVSDIAQALRSELSGISGALSGLRGQFEPAREAVRSNALSTLRDALLTGDLAGTGNAARAAAQISAESFTSSEAFKREQARTLFLLDSLEREGVQQIDTAEQSLNVLQNIDGGIAAIVGVLESLANEIVFDGGHVNIPQFANGGSHSGGMRIVGERGPELEMTGPSHITSNSDLKQALASNADLIKELREMKQYIRQTTKNTGETRDKLNRWDRTGLPEERVFE